MATYEIIIRNETNNNNKSPIAGSGTQTTNTMSGGDGNNDKNSSAAAALAKGLVSYNRYLKPFVDSAITQRINTITLRTGAEELEERLAFKQSMISKGMGLLESVAIGAAVGNLPGAVIGAVMSLTTMAIEYGNKAEQLSLQQSTEAISLGYLNARAGGSVASFSGSRMKNQ